MVKCLKYVTMLLLYRPWQVDEMRSARLIECSQGKWFEINLSPFCTNILLHCTLPCSQSHCLWTLAVMAREPRAHFVSLQKYQFSLKCTRWTLWKIATVNCIFAHENSQIHLTCTARYSCIKRDQITRQPLESSHTHARTCSPAIRCEVIQMQPPSLPALFHCITLECNNNHFFSFSSQRIAHTTRTNTSS